MTSPSLLTLQQQTTKLLLQSVSIGTRDQYYACFQKYHQFSVSHNLLVMPLCEANLMLYATFVSNYSSHKNVSLHLAAIKFFAQIWGYPSQFRAPSCLSRLLKGIKKSHGAKYRKAKRTPITPSLLLTLGTNLFRSPLRYNDKVMLWAAMLVAFFGFLRVSEYTAEYVKSYDPQFTLCWEDVSTSSLVAHITLKASKTDPFREGVTVRVAANGTRLCPVTALVQYMNLHPCRNGPFFQFWDGRYLTRKGLVRVLNLIKPEGIRNMSSHSFRIGAATTAAAAGYPKWAIQTLGRWASDCYRLYIRMPESTINYLSKTLANLSLAATTPFDPTDI